MEESELFSEVVVVGAGNAALTAALAAREAGAQVLVLEKAPYDDRGGNSRFTGGIVRFAQGGLEDILPLVPDLTEAEIARLEVEPYSAETYLDDIMRLSEGKADPALTRVLVDNSYQTVRWMQSLGVSFELYQTAVRQGGRIYFPAGAVIQFWSGGPGLTNRLFRAAEGRGIDVVYDTPVLDLLTSAEGRIQGVRAQTPEGLMDIHAGAVILACGGFEASDTRRARYLGAEWEKVHVRGTRHNTGELLDRLEALDAQLGGHLDGAHAVPVDAGSPEVGDLNLGDLTARLSYPLGIMVNQDARRFIDEGMDFKSYSYTVMGPEILRQPGGTAYQIFDQQTVERLEARYGSGSPPVIAESIEVLAEKLGLNPRGAGTYRQRIQRCRAGRYIQPGHQRRQTHSGDRTTQNQLGSAPGPAAVCGVWRTLWHHLYLRRRDGQRGGGGAAPQWCPHPWSVCGRRDHRRHFLSQLP